MSEKIKLDSVTLLGLDCLDVTRLAKAMDISQHGIEFADVKLLTSLSTDDQRAVQVPHIGSVEAYSKFCVCDMHKYVETEHVLVVQWDGFVLNPQSWRAEFLEYDYIGAPIHIDAREFWYKHFNLPRAICNTAIVGNGGFSLRSKRFLESCAEFANKRMITQYQPEDLQLCFFNKDLFTQAGMKYASYEIARDFSIEGSQVSYCNQFGFHGLSWTDISDWITKNPEWGIEQVLTE